MNGKTLILATGCTGWITKYIPQTTPKSVVGAAPYFKKMNRREVKEQGHTNFNANYR